MPAPPNHQSPNPPTVAIPVPLFRKVYINTMFMPPTSGFNYTIQARCSPTAWPECVLFARRLAVLREYYI